MLKIMNDVSLYMTITLTILQLIGYLLGITVICASLYVLFRTFVMMLGKIVVYITTKIIAEYANTTIISIMSEESI